MMLAHAPRRPAAFARALFVALALGAPAACKVVPASPDAMAADASSDADVRVTRGTIGDTTRIYLGERASFGGGRFVVAFEEIESESRCPANVVCVQAGDVAARFRLWADGRRAGTTLHQFGEPTRVEYAGWTVRLANVEPYPGTVPENMRMRASALVVVTR